MLFTQDAKVRERALDPSSSFIIQAPAGSGKTELLTQRFLTLLGICQAPEEVLAVTFTKKAAGEMKHRLVHALQNVQNGHQPQSEHAKKTFALAQKVILQNEKLGWDLDKNPSRLKIITIDSLALGLTKNLPLLSAFGAEPNVLEDATELYRQAIEQLLPRLEVESDVIGQQFHTLLDHLDNRIDVLVRLCVTLLSKREQWLPYIMYAKSEEMIRSVLEHALHHVVFESIEKIEARFDVFMPELIELARYAASNMAEESPIVDCKVYPNILLEKLSYWNGLHALLMTQTGTFRKTVNKNQGFYPKTQFKDKEEQAVATIMKDNMLEMLKSLSMESSLESDLNEIALLPPLHYEPNQWQALEAIIELMPVLCANLKVVFQARGQIDFVELAMAATTALGTPEAPTELALALDYQINHILIDEFQDTSEIQYDLFTKLIQEWQPGEGRSLFLVGDPMQSIYRFRGAEVGVFLRAKQYGLAQIPLEYLRLTNNFRSSPRIVEFVNDCGQELFPKEEDIAKGAISYLTSTATRELEGQVHCLAITPNATMAQTVVDEIDALLKQDANCTIAVLVRYRQHAYDILNLLKSRQIAYDAIDMFPMGSQAYIQDLIVLIRAMTNLSDRIAWVALLRTPFVGFNLSDVHQLASQPFEELVYARLSISYLHANLSEEGNQRCQRVFPIIKRWLEQRGRLSIALWIKNLWLALGGPCFLKMDLDSPDLRHFFDIVDEFETQQRSFLELESYLARQYAQSAHKQKPPVQIMTIHKAKGLEFDHVFIPAMEARPRSDDMQLFLWMHQNHDAHSELFMAPIRSSLASSDKIYRFVEHKLKQKLQYESNRLLYVALTRAKQNAYLIAQVSKSEEGIASVKGSFLNMIQNNFSQQLKWVGAQDDKPDEKLNDKLISDIVSEDSRARDILYHRLDEHWCLPEPLDTYLSIDIPLKDDNVQGELPPLWHHKEQVLSPDTLRHVGTLVHQMFYRAVTIGLAAFKESWHKSPIDTMLKGLGVPLSELAVASEQVRLAVKNTLSCPKGNWILSAVADSQAEWPLWVNTAEPYKIIIDRAFVEDDTQWIVDYKVIHQQDQSQSDWTKVVRTYESQLKTYANALRILGRENVRTGLYFPIQAHWIEIS